METVTLPDAGDLRALLAREQLPIYLIAARVGIHPSRLSRLIHGRLPLTPAVAQRIADAIATEARERQDHA